MNLLSSSLGHLTNLSGTTVPDADDIWHVDLFPSASNPHGRQGVARVTNRSSKSGVVTIQAFDDTTTTYEPVQLHLRAGATAEVNSDDLELGNRDKGLRGSVSAGTGTWRLALSSDAFDFAVNAYVQTADGFLRAMQETAPHAGAARRVAFLNPANDVGPVGVLRLVNRSSELATVSIDGTDDLGLRPGTTVQVSVPATTAVELTTAQLESGEANAITSGALGDGTGRWRLRVDGNVKVLSLMSSDTGHLTNLSWADTTRRLGPLPIALLPPPTSVALEHVEDRQLRARWSSVADATRYDVDLLKNGVREEIRSVKRTRSTAIRWWFRSPPGTYTLRVRSLNADGVRGPWSTQSNEIVFD